MWPALRLGRLLFLRMESQVLISQAEWTLGMIYVLGPRYYDASRFQIRGRLVFRPIPVGLPSLCSITLPCRNILACTVCSPRHLHLLNTRTCTYISVYKHLKRMDTKITVRESAELLLAARGRDNDSEKSRYGAVVCARARMQQAVSLSDV